MQEKRKEERFSRDIILKHFHHCLVEVLPGLQFSVEVVDVSRRGLGFRTILPESHFAGKEVIRLFPIKESLEIRAMIKDIRAEDDKTRIGVELIESEGLMQYRDFLDYILDKAT